MTPVPWATTPTRPPAASSARLLAALALGVCLLAGTSGRAADNPGGELERLARALRQERTPARYQALARFAEEHPESEWSAQASFALGMADFEAERWQAARERFDAARGSPPLRDLATLYLARAALELGALEAAHAPLQELLAPANPLSDLARALEADRRLRAGQARAAVDWLARLPDLETKPALLFALAKAQRAAGEPLAAVQTLQRVYYEFPLSPEAEPANQLLSEMRSVELKGEAPAPSEQLRRARAEKLWARQAYRGARSAYLDLSVRAGEPVRTEARLRAAAALYLLGEAAVACDELKRIPRATPELEGEFRAYRARCALRAGDTAQVETELAALAALPQPNSWYAEALLAAGNTALARGESTRARDFYQRLVQAVPSGAAAAEAHWKLAWFSYQGREAGAPQLMEEHLERFPVSSFWPRALYWRARAAVAAGGESLASSLVALLRQYAPREYLTQKSEPLARAARGPAGGEADLPAWLEKLTRLLARPSGAWPGEPPADVQAQIETAGALERLGLAELAGEALQRGVERGPHPALALAQARLAFAEQRYARATEILNRTHPAYWRYPLDDLPREAWEILFPRPYWDVIERESRRQGLDPYLVAALIRQESRFERDAVSSAGALGLMQLMPATARRLAGAPNLSASRIHDPELNIRLGTRFLVELQRRFDGNLEKVVAGYNAGGTRVEGWASQGSYREPAEFVESIPVTQTREFVYIVLRNYRFYRDLYAPAPGLAADGELAAPPPPE